MSGLIKFDCRHDDIAELIGIPALPFEVMYPDKAKDFKRTLSEYLKELLRVKSRRPGQSVADNSSAELHGSVEIDPSGYPIAPRPQSWTKVPRTVLEPLYRSYITKHYRK